MDSVVTHILNPSEEEKFNKIRDRSIQFLAEIDDVNKTPVRVFDPLSKTCLEQLEVVREVSAYLQQQKEEYTRAVEEAALAAEAKTKTDTATEASTEQTVQ